MSRSNGKQEWKGSSVEIGALDTVYLNWRELTSSWCKCQVIKKIGVQDVEACNGEYTNRLGDASAYGKVREMDEDAEVLEVRERQLHNVPEESRLVVSSGFQDWDGIARDVHAG